MLADWCAEIAEAFKLQNTCLVGDRAELEESGVRLESSTAIFCHHEEMWGAVCRFWDILVCADSHDWNGNSKGSQSTNVVSE